MWSDWLAFCDCRFHSVCPLMKKNKRLMEASWWERLIEGKTGSGSDMLGPCSVNLQSNVLLMGGAVFPPCYLPGGQTLVEVMKIMWPPSEHPMHLLLHSAPPTLQQATTNPRFHWRLLDTPEQVWVSLLWGHRSFLLGPGARSSVCALQDSIPQSCVSSGSSVVGLMAISSKRAYATPRSA